MEMRTLLIGLGGTGCRIVDRVAGRIKKNPAEDQYIRCIGMDTDAHESRRIHHIDVISTSKEQTVEEYLRHTENWKEWFPDAPILKSHNMLDGAAQIRPLSRLAFLEAQTRFGKLEQAIRDLNLARGEVTPSNMRVMIVSSFAGGTGSGMFLHTALWIRKYFRDTYHMEVLIRGLFAFPDMFMASTGNPTEKQSKYANAYAAVRELNAINQAAMGNSEKSKRINISFDGLFDSRRDTGRADQMPYDLMFFVDDLNLAGRKLPDLTHYEKLMANITYLQVYSPLSKPQYTAEDNRFNTIIETRGEALYGSAGASALEYPYEDIKAYCGLRATFDSITSSWMFFDEEYRKALAEHKEALKDDPSRELHRDKHYIELAQNLFDDDPREFRFMLEQTTDVLNGNRSQREETYFAGIDRLINKRITSNAQVQFAKANCEVNKKIINDPDEIENHVASIERNLFTYQQTIDQAVTNEKGSLIQAIVCDAYENIKTFSGGEYNIIQLLQTNNHIVHPLSARLLLYRLRQHVETERLAAEQRFNKCTREMNNYRKKDWNKKTPEREPAEATASNVSEAPFGRMNPKYKEFRESYIAESRRQRDNLDAYFKAKMAKLVLTEVQSRLDILIEQYERFFDSLPIIQRALKVDVEALENKHNTNTDLSLFVHASKAAKEKIYDSLTVQVSNDESHEVSGAIFRALYNETCQEISQKRNRNNDDFSEEERTEKRYQTMDILFRSNVVKYNTEKVARDNQTILDINAYQALKLHCMEVRGKTPQGILAQVAKKGVPFLKYNTQDKLDIGDMNVSAGEFPEREVYNYSIIFWGFTPDIQQDILRDHPDLHGIMDSYFAKIENSVITPLQEVSPRFSKYRMEYYHSAYGIALRDITKFSETGPEAGVFYRNYQTRINRMLKNNADAITPHLSLNWHQRQNLPYINEEKDKVDDARIAKALWLALAYGKVTLLENSRKQLQYTSKLINASGEPVLWDEQRLGPENACQLYQALKNDERAISKAAAIENNEFADELKKVKKDTVESMEFIKGLVSVDKLEQNAAAFLCNVAFDPINPKKEYEVLWNSLDELIEEFCTPVSQDVQEVEDAIAKVKVAIINQSGIREKGSSTREYDLFKNWM